jgi:hypothetical protein
VERLAQEKRSSLLALLVSSEITASVEDHLNLFLVDSFTLNDKLDQLIT